MTNNLLTLFCVVDGESRPFSVKIESTETISALKDEIKKKKSPRFDDVAADELTLWSVSIPIADDDDDDDDDDELPIYINNMPKRDKKKLKAVANTVSEIFGNSPDGKQSMSSSSALLQGNIEAELADILEGVSHNFTTSTIDPKKVEASQREKLGRFYKRPLPYHDTAEDISLVMLGLELDKQAKTSEGETLRSIVEGDIGRYTDHPVVAMVAPSGSGKTATVVDLASRHFVIYCVCCIPSPTISPGFKDPNFITLAKDVENIYATIINREHEGSRDPLDVDSEVKLRIGDRVEIDFLARLLFLQLLLDKNPNLEPRQFFREQTSKGASTIARLVNRVQDYHVRTIRAMLDQVQTRIRNVLLPRRLGVVIALDEAQVAANSILAGKLISPSALIKNRNVLFDNKNQIQSEFRRGFLTPLSATLSNMQATLVILGTALSLQNADHVYSAIAKETNDCRITDFPSFNEDDVTRMLSDLVEMEDCVSQMRNAAS
ncbi:hypothetical protein EDD11_009648 [Mortierella claussenii]|nr:hypothetical protein EDD11_009648 [Mortierella claussenii]